MLLGTEAIIHGLNVGAIVCDPAPTRIEGAQIDITLGAQYWVFDANPFAYHHMMHLVDADPREYFKAGKVSDDVCIGPGGFILAHTAEYIGTAPGSGIVPMLHTRSTLARWGLSVCTANAGQGDTGYTSRWTLEIINPHPVAVAIPVGARIGSISFHRLEGHAADYTPGTRYNATRQEWTPDAMLPRKGNW